MKKTTKEYSTGIMRIVEERVVIPIGEYQMNLLNLHFRDMPHDDYVRVSLTYHIGGRILLGRFDFSEEPGKQWKLRLPGQSKPLSFPKQSTMTEYVRRNYAREC